MQSGLLHCAGEGLDEITGVCFQCQKPKRRDTLRVQVLRPTVASENAHDSTANHRRLKGPEPKSKLMVQVQDARTAD